MKKIALLLFALSLLFRAEIYAVPRSSTALGAGGGGVATVEPGESSFMNPATLVHLKKRHFFSTFQKDLVAVSMTENSKDIPFPGAVTYAKTKENEQEAQVFGLSFADYVVGRLSVGLTLNYWQAKLDQIEQKRSNSFNGSIGLAYSPNQKTGFGLSFENLIEPEEKFSKIHLMDRATRFGMNYVFMEWFRTRADVVFTENPENNRQEITPQLGMETYMGKFLIVRAGWNKPQGQRESWSAGAGLDLPRFTLDYAARWNVDGTRETRHSFDLGLPF